MHRLLSVEAAEAPGTPTAEAKRPSLLAPHASSLDPASPVEAQQPAEAAGPEPVQNDDAAAGGSAAAPVDERPESSHAAEGAQLSDQLQPPVEMQAKPPAVVPEEAEQPGPAASPTEEPSAAPGPDQSELEREAHLAQVRHLLAQASRRVLCLSSQTGLGNCRMYLDRYA